jgi:hypothetical protein
VVGQSKVVIGTDHDDSFSIDDDLGVLRGFEFPEKEIVATVLQSGFILRCSCALFKDILKAPILNYYPLYYLYPSTLNLTKTIILVHFRF